MQNKCCGGAKCAKQIVWWSEMFKINGVVERIEQNKWCGGAKCAKKWCGRAKCAIVNGVVE